jgi:hypothetical protein
MIRSYPVCLIPVALTLVGFGLSTTPAIAQTTYSFSGNYDLLNGGEPITPDFSYSRVDVRGTSTDALYSLTKMIGSTYLHDFGNGEFIANTDPATLGFPDLPIGFFILEGRGEDKLFGTESSRGTYDLETFKVSNRGTIVITGGEGRFKGATGTLFFDEVGTRGIPYIGKLSVNGSFQTVPEPRADTILVGMGVIGAGLLLRRRSHSLAKKDKGSSQISPLAKV